MAPPLGDIAHLGHVELLTPALDHSLWFFTEILGLTEDGRSGDSVYLRTWDDYEHHSLVLTAHPTSGIRSARGRRELMSLSACDTAPVGNEAPFPCSEARDEFGTEHNLDFWKEFDS